MTTGTEKKENILDTVKAALTPVLWVVLLAFVAEGLGVCRDMAKELKEIHDYVIEQKTEDRHTAKNLETLNKGMEQHELRLTVVETKQNLKD